MTTAATIADALAYIAITGSQKFLHWSTRTAILDRVSLNKDLYGKLYLVDEAGMEMARKTKMWKAHEKILSMGFEFQATRRFRPRFLPYLHPDQVSTPAGNKMFRMAFTGWHGTVYVDMQQADGQWRTQEVK